MADDTLNLGAVPELPDLPTRAEMEQIGFGIDDVILYIAQLAQAFIQWFQQLVGGFAQGIANLITNITTWIQSLVGGILQSLTTIITEIRTLIEGFIAQLREFFLTIFNAIRDVTVSVIQKVEEWVINAGRTVSAALQDMIDTVVGWVTDAADAIGELVGQVIEDVRAVATAVIEAIGGWLETIQEAAIEILSTIAEAVQREYEVLLHGAESILSTLQERLVSLRDAFLEGMGSLLDGMEGIADETLAPIRDSLKAWLGPLVESMDGATVAQLAQAVEIITAPHTLILNNREDAKALLGAVMPQDKFGKWLFLIAFSFITILTVYRGIGEANGQRVLQEYARQAPYNVLSPAESVACWRQDALGHDAAIDNITASGLSRSDAERLLAASGSVPSLQDILSMWQRGIINEAKLDEALSRLGLDGSWPSHVKQAAKILPGVQDLISMAVREAFNPDVAQRFGQYEDYPSQLTAFAEQQGLSEEWAKRYWAAHWGLPSVQMGYEMLHRGIINLEDLNLLLKAQDVMPFWRPKLVAMSFAPYTRVDIRRMHQVGVLTDADVKRSYLDLGYDEEKATNLTAFTIKLNRGGTPDDEAELGKLTRTTILGFYRDGVITRPRALALLIAVGITPDAAELYLASEDADHERRNRTIRIDLVIEQAEAGTITFEQAQDQLRKMELSELEIQSALTRLLRAQQKKAKLPTRAEADTFVKMGRLQESDYLDLLSRLGYSLKWSKLFWEAARAKK